MISVHLLWHLVGHLWGGFNTVVGLLFGLGGHYTVDKTNRVFRVYGGWMVRIFTYFGFIGMCVGDVVLSKEPLAPNIDRHELVHATQSRLLGPLYLPATILGYAIGLVLCPKCPHDASPLEVWADVASDNAHTNFYLCQKQK
jgi:hypothetical protein